MTARWSCPACNRTFSRKNQRHACGTGDRAEVLRNRSPEIAALYTALENFVTSLGPVEFVTRERYVLLRTTRIFADAVVGPSAIRLAIHLPQKEEHPLFFKVAADRRQVTHVAKVQFMSDLAQLEPFLRTAHAYSMR